MGQRQSPEADVDSDSPYAGKSLAELEHLVAERGIALPQRGVPCRPDRLLLSTLLSAYDAGMGAAGGTAAFRTAPEGADTPDALECSSVLSVLQAIRDAPGHMGVDIGGTLVKMALALPHEAALEHRLPEAFGLTGRTHGHLQLGLQASGEQFVVKFISGSTSQMERAVQHLGRRRNSRRARLPSTSSAPEIERPVLASTTHGSGTADFTSPDSEKDLEELHVEDEFCRQLSGWSDIGSASYRPVRRIATAGGGACKFAPLFRDALRVEIEPVKELSAVVDGLLLLARGATATSAKAPSRSAGEAEGADVVHISEDHEVGSASSFSRGAELFTVGEDGRASALPWPRPLFPLLLVNMGSGVSMLRVDSAAANDYVRVGGTACGGGTFLGLARALTSADTFEEALALAEGGNAMRADKLVSDIYGEEGSAALGLPGSLTASNFGKLSERADSGAQGLGCSEQDLARSLLQMVTQQSVLLATALARHIGCMGRVFFVGGFVDEPNRLARAAISANFRSLGGCAYFLRHSDFLGALGSLKCALQAAEGR
mmetsp:Transcript_101908/g.328917  ORF Transcript_101908/g.328917 Transcript_101908/m.328917 type:complete len:546 (+) Transcript_101908:135-1772(+)